MIHSGEQAGNGTSSQPRCCVHPARGRFIPLLQIKCIQAERIESKAGKAVQSPEVALV